MTPSSTLNALQNIFNANSVELTIQKVLYWFANAGLQVNESKTEAILISSVKNAPSISSIKVRNVEVKLSNSLKCLGVTIEKHLDMEKQVKTVAKNCFHYLRILHSLRNFVDFETRILLVRCLIMSRLDYCNSILNGLGMKKLSILQKVQNRACRFDYLRLSTKFLSLSKYIQFRHLKNHHHKEKALVHLTSEGVNNIKNLIKEKLLFKKYSKELNNLGPERTFECDRDSGCLCGLYDGN